MKANLLLSITMIVIALIYLVLSILIPSDVRIGSCIICTVLAIIFYLLYRFG